jgi:predicted GNAT family acetyltransferase
MHPLERPVWSALTSRQSAVAVTTGGAVRFSPEYGIFAALADESEASLAALGALVAATGDVAVVEAKAPPPVPGTRVTSEALCWQMVMTDPAPAPPPAFEIAPLTEADAPEMLALATLTKPGPFFGRTHQLGRFIGVRQDGTLVAMAGERMQPTGFTEVSGVCTLPDHRGRGYAAALMRQVAGAIRARGETPFLHAYAANTGAIGLYETLGFRFSRELVMTSLTGEA